ncbi:tetratricopeptide repeat protein, partial [Streptomyces sp. NPDC085614]|uniref:tetratricopeptide repeat protein n=1 Tax=Streptomyces sp. NPDC085614 TaxID=3365733 RepID=UPI0037D6804B
GQVEEARDLAADTLTRQRQTLGEDHPDTLSTASNLAIDLAALGQVEEARDLAADTLTRQRQVLGEDHPNTLILRRVMEILDE